MPNQIDKQLESLRSNFFWGSQENTVKHKWIAWKYVLASKQKGGIGIGSLKALNQSLLQKWRWRYVHNRNALWVKLINVIHGAYNGGSGFFSHLKRKGTWSKIAYSINALHSNGIIPHHTLTRKVNDGKSTAFWHEFWLGNFSLKVKFPRLYQADPHKNCLVCDKWNNGWVWNWSRSITRGIILDQSNELLHLLESVHLSDNPDVWHWDLANSKIFTVKETRLYIDDALLPDHLLETRWCRFIPKKVNILSWRALRDRLPNRWNLSRKGIDIPSLLCPVCSSFPETNFHLFWDCNVASAIWKFVFKWVDIHPPNILDLNDLFNWLDESTSIKSSCKTILDSIFGTVIWVIWSFRNEVIFGKRCPRSSELTDKIIHYSFLWYSNRNRKASKNWNYWMQNPLLDFAL